METTNIHYHMPELDSEVEKRTEDAKKQIQLKTENYAMRNLPPPGNKNIKPFYLEDHQVFQGILDYVNRILQIKTMIHHVTEHKKVTENRLRETYNQQSLAKEKGDAIDTKLKNRKAPYSKKRIPLVWIATVILTLFDGIYNKQAFISWGSGTVEAILQGLFLAFLIAVIAHLFKWIVSHGKTVWQRRTIIAAVFAVMICLFTYMAVHRAAYLQQQTAADSGITIAYSPVPFILISTLIFSATVLLHYRYLPTQEQRAEMDIYERLIQDRRDNEAQQLQLKEQEAAIEQEHVGLRQKTASIIEYGKSVESTIISTAKEGLALFKRINLMHRKDNCCPQSFEDDSYPFVFNTSFSELLELKS